MGYESVWERCRFKELEVGFGVNVQFRVLEGGIETDM